MKLFLSFYAFLLLPVLLLGMISMVWASDTVYQNTVSAYTAAMQNTAARLSEAIAGMKSVVNLFQKDSTLYRLAYMRGEEVNYSRVSLSQLQAYKNQLILHCTNSPLYDEIVLFFPQKNYIISSLGIWRMNWFWEDEFHVVNRDQEELQASLGQEVVFPGLTITSYGYTKQGAAFLLPAITSAQGAPLMCALFWVNDRSMADQLSNLLLYDGAIAAVFDGAGELVCACDSGGTSEGYRERLAEGGRLVEDASRYEPLEWTHPDSGWRYAVLVPKDAIYGASRVVRFWIGAIMAVVLLLGGFMSWELALLNYRPLEHFFHSLGDYFKTDNRDMRQIEDRLLEMLREQEQLRESANANRGLLQYAALNHLLEGDEHYAALAHQSSLAMLGIKMPYPRYRVAIAYGATDSEALAGTARAACEGQPIRCYAVQQNDRVVLLLNYQEEATLPGWTERVSPLCASLCFSGPAARAQGLAQAYREACHTLEHRPLGRRVCDFEELPPERLVWYPEDAEHRLLCEIHASNRVSALKVLEQLEQKNDDATSRRKLLVSLEMSLLKTDDCRGELAAELRGLSQPDSLDAEAQMAYARRMIDAAIAHQARQTNEERSELARQILLYVDENICSEQLSLASTAEKFSVSAAYLSRFFKEQFKVGYLDYVNRKRVLLAKEILALEQCRVQEAAARVGVGSDATLRRLFKKYEGVLPSQSADKTAG